VWDLPETAMVPEMQDTLSAIANFFSLSIGELKGANGRRISDPNAISVSQILIIPEA